MVLPLMDARSIPQLYEDIKSYYLGKITDEATMASVLDLFEYYGNQWINGDKGFAPNDISCFRKVIRTNNQLEQWHGQIYGEGGRKKLNLYMLTELLGKDSVEYRKRATGIQTR